MCKSVVRVLTVFVCLLVPGVCAADWLYILTGSALITRDLDASGTAPIQRIAPITGLAADETMRAIDVRTIDGQLYGLASRPTNGIALEARLYRIHPFTGAATLVGVPETILPLEDSSEVGFDYDPVNDRFRVITQTRLNYRIIPNTGQMVDSDGNRLNGITPDHALPGLTTVAGLAYTNNFPDAPSTTLYGIDNATRTLLRIGGLGGSPSPNTGAITTIGPLNLPPGTDGNHVGFDIAGVTGNAYLSLKKDALEYELFRVDLQTGTATSIAILANGQIDDIAVASRPVALLGVTSTGYLVYVWSHMPGQILAEFLIDGQFDATELITSIDWRPSSALIYAFTSTGRLFTINNTNGTATLVGAVEGARLGAKMRVDPVTDTLHLIDIDGVNQHIDETGGRLVAVTDRRLTDDGGNAYVGVASFAYAINDIRDEATLFAIDDPDDTLVTIGPRRKAQDAAGGEVFPVAFIGTNVLATSGLSFDPASHVLYMVTGSPAIGSTLFTLNGETGKMTPIGVIGVPADKTTLVDITIMPVGVTQFAKPSIEVSETAGTLTVGVNRVNGLVGPILVSYHTKDGTATAGADYSAVSGTILFLQNESHKDITIPIGNDSVGERTETFTIVLDGQLPRRTFDTPRETTVRIIDDETPPSAKPTVTITTPTTAPTFAATSAFIDVAGTASDDKNVVSVTWADDRGHQGTAQGTTSWLIPALAIEPGTTTITVTAHDEIDQVTTDTIVVTRTTTGPSSFIYVLAEGATGTFFDLDILLANPDTAPAAITLTFLKEDGSTIVDTRTLPATSRMTVRVDEIAGMESTAASTVVTADRQIVVERTMRWAGGAGYGAHTEKAVEGAALTWYFAEGSQGFFSTYLLLANPGAAESVATVTYLREGESPLTRTYTLTPRSRRTVDAGADPELVNRSFGMTVAFTQPGVAERAMYFGADPLWKAGHESAGVTVPSTSWFLAEGATGPFFDTFLLLSNPQTTAADVTLTYLIADGTPITKMKTVPASGRLTINIEQDDPALANVAVATQVSSSVPIVAERAQYWPYTFDQWYEAHNAFGVVATGQRWGLAEGRVGGADAYETYILLANPGSTAAAVTITFLRTNGTTVTKTFTVPAQSRVNVATGANGPVPELANEEFGAVIASTQPIAVERAMYASPGGLTWSAGTNATATRLTNP